MNPLLSIIILTHNNPDDLWTLYKSILRQNYNLKAVEIIVVDNGSNPFALEKIKEILREGEPQFMRLVLVILETNLGVGKGYNEGIRQAKGKFILKCDTDIELPANFLKKMLSTMEAYPQIGVLGAVEYSYSERAKVHTVGTNFINPFFAERNVRLSKIITPVDLVPGPAMMIRREVIERINGFDPQFFLYYDDYDFCYRAKKEGFEVAVNKQINFFHKGRPANILRLSPQRIRSMTKNRIIFIRKHCHGMFLVLPFIYLLLATLKKAFWLLIRGRFANLRALIKGSLEGWTNPIY